MALLGPVKRSQRLGTYRPPARDLDVTHLRVWVPGTGPRRLHADLRALTTSIELTQTLEGASTLTLHVRDYDRKLLRSPLAEQRSTLSLDAIEYTLVKVSHADGNEVTLIFEETAVNVCRRFTDARKSSRDNTTRAQFIRGLIADDARRAAVRIPFNCPELNARQPIAG
jgi:hypothetical protein